MASCNTNALLAQASQYGSLWPFVSSGLALELLVKIAQISGSPATDIPTLVSQGKCFACYGPLEMAAMRALLWRDIAVANGITLSSNPVTLAGSNACMMNQDGESEVLVYLAQLYTLSTTTDSLASLITAAKCYLCYNASELNFAQLVLLQGIAGSTETPAQLMTRASCYTCLTVPILNAMVVGIITQITSISGGGPVVPFDPSQLPGLQLWLKSESIVGILGASFPIWADSSGHGNDADRDAFSEPVISLNTYNGKKAVYVNNDSSPQGYTVPSIFSANNSRYIFVVFRADAAFSPFTGHICGVDDAAVVANRFWVTYSTDFAGEPFQSTGGNDINGNYVLQGQFLISSGFYYSSADSTPRSITDVTGGATFNTTAAVAVQNTYANAFEIGVSSVNNNQFSGDICEIIAGNAALTPTQVSNTMTYLNAKFGIVPA